MFGYVDKVKALSLFQVLAPLTCLLMLSATIFYIFRLNLFFPFLTMDEQNALLTPEFSNILKTVIENGRLSHLLAWFPFKILSFQNVATLDLMPRFLSVMSLYFVLCLYLQGIYRSWVYAIAIASVIICGHTVDWQHDGMFAFFGGYNVFAAAFLLALHLSRQEKTLGIVQYPLVVMLLLISFGSEFFLGLAALFFVLFYFLEKRRDLNVHCFAIAVTCYLLLFIVFRLIGAEQAAFVVTSAGMEHYLYGNITEGASIYDMGRGALLYVYYSIPTPAAALESRSLLGYGLAIVIFLSIITYLHKNTIRSVEQSWEILLLSVCLIFVPSILLSLQPPKLAWILSGDSNRYAFSYYTWIGFMILLSYALKNEIRKTGLIMIVISVALSSIVLSSMLKSQSFASRYEPTRNNWLEINRDLSNARGEKHYVGHDQILGLQNWITPVDFDYLSKYAAKYYQVTLKVKLSKDPEKIGATLPSFLTRIEGLSGYEQGLEGRWSDGDELTLVFREALPSKFTLILGVNDLFGPNLNQPISVEVGDWSGTFPGEVNENIELGISNSKVTNIVKIKIPHPVTPMSYIGGHDNRLLGIRLKKLGIRTEPDQN
jgi:hypothetical protein